MQTFQTDQCLPHDLSFSPDGRRLLVGCRRRVLLDTLGTEPPVMLEPIRGELTTFAQLALGGTALIYITLDSIRVWDFASQQLSAWAGSGVVVDLVVAPGGATVYIAYAIPHEFTHLTEIHVHDIATGKLKAKFPRREGRFAWLTLSADGRRLAGRGSYDVGVWDLTSPDDPDPAFLDIKIGTVGLYLADLALSAEGTRLATVTGRGLTLWDITNGTAATEVFRSGKHKRRVTTVACSPTKPITVTGDTAGQVFLWDHTGRVLTRFEWGLEYVRGLAFAPDGLRCAAVNNTGKVVIWDVDV